VSFTPPSKKLERVDMHYANYSRRIQAVILDSFVLLVLFIGTAFLLSKVPIHTYWKIGIVANLMIFLEPLLVTFTGASLGHHAKMLRVQNGNTGKNLTFVAAFVRFVIKTVLGWISVFLIFTTKRHQALHDVVVGSVVVMNKRAQNKGLEGVTEQVFQEEGFAYPSIFRRLLIIILYTVGIFIIGSLLFALLLSEACLFQDHCKNMELFIQQTLSLFLMVLTFIVIAAGWKSGLWGCRRVRLETS